MLLLRSQSPPYSVGSGLVRRGCTLIHASIVSVFFAFPRSPVAESVARQRGCARLTAFVQVRLRPSLEAVYQRHHFNTVRPPLLAWLGPTADVAAAAAVAVVVVANVPRFVTCPLTPVSVCPPSSRSTPCAVSLARFGLASRCRCWSWRWSHTLHSGIQLDQRLWPLHVLTWLPLW